MTEQSSPPKPKVFCIGLSRTGTTTLHEILSDLGLKSGHYFGFLLRQDPDWDRCDEYDALSDSPIPYCYKEMDQRYPGSKFISTTRNKDKWLESMKWMFTHGKVIWDWDMHVHRYHDRVYGTRSFNEKIFSEHWDRHHRDVAAYFADRPDCLMAIELEKGFQVDEICAFLNLPIREIEQKRSNAKRDAKLRDRIAYQARYSSTRMKQIVKKRLLRR